jgi:hypothetical protein
MKRKLNIFDKIGTLIPGYKGYQEREGRRECDRQLKEQIADKLTLVEKDINSLMANIEFENLSEIEKIRKKVNNLNGLIKYSPYGASAFFSDSVIKETELENIYQHDLNILDATNELTESAKSKDVNSIRNKIELLEKTITERNQYLKDI